MSSRQIIIALVLLLLCFSGSAWAGWSTQESNTVENINAVYFFDDNIGYFAGNNGKAYTTGNGGITWESISYGTVNYNDIFFPIASTEGYLLGSSPSFNWLKTTNNGVTWVQQVDATHYPELLTANFRKGSTFGSYRKIVASTGTSSDSYILTSSNQGGSWTYSALTSLDAYGILLSSGESGVPTTWVWGQYYKGPDISKYVILKDNVQVWTGTTAVRDVFFVKDYVDHTGQTINVNKLFGWAVGDLGLVLRTTTGGDYGAWTQLSNVTTKNIKAANFITPNFGWLVGEQGLATFTTNGIDTTPTWNEYDANSLGVNINDLAVRFTIISADKASVHAYLAGNSGKLFKLTAPKITGVSPNSRSVGWLGTITISGEGFMEGATVRFYKAGASSLASLLNRGTGVTVNMVRAKATADSSVIVVSTSYETAALLKSVVSIDQTTGTGTREMEVELPDATLTLEASALTVTSQAASNLKIPTNTAKSIWLDNSKYTTANINTIYSLGPTVTFEVTDSANLISVDNLNTYLLISFPGNPDPDGTIPTNYAYYNALASDCTPTSFTTFEYNISHDQTKSQLTLSLEAQARGKLGSLEIYAERKDNGNFARFVTQVFFSLALTDPISKEVQGTTPEATAPGLEASLLLGTNNIDPARNTPAMIRFTGGKVYQSLTLRVFDQFGRLILTKKVGEAAAASGLCTKSQGVSAQGVMVTKYSFSFLVNEWPPNMPAGIYLVRITNDLTGQLVAKNLMMITPSDMHK